MPTTLVQSLSLPLPEREGTPCHGEVHLLAREEDWLLHKAEVEVLESLTRPNPWHTWDYLFEFWRTFAPGKPCWLVLVRRQKPPENTSSLLAAALFLEEETRRGVLSLRVLRSMDSMALRVRPFWLDPRQEEEGRDALLAALPLLLPKKRSDLVTLYRQDPQSTAELTRSLSQKGIPVKEQLFTWDQQIVLPDKLDDYLASRSKKMLYELRRLERKATRELQQAPLYWRFRGDLWNHEEGPHRWRQFEQIWRSSWQYQEAQQSKIVDPERVLDFWGKIARQWSQRQWLDLSFLSLDGQVIAAALGLKVHDTFWGLLTAYDPQFQRYSPGGILFLKNLVDSHQRHDRLLILGGEANDWKSRWSNHQEPIYHVEWPLQSWKASLWKLRSLLPSSLSSP